MYMYIHTYTYTHLSLSLCIYIYIYIYICTHTHSFSAWLQHMSANSAGHMFTVVTGSPHNVFENFIHVGNYWTDKFSSHGPQFLLEVACLARAGVYCNLKQHRRG